MTADEIVAKAFEAIDAQGPPPDAEIKSEEPEPPVDKSGWVGHPPHPPRRKKKYTPPEAREPKPKEPSQSTALAIIAKYSEVPPPEESAADKEKKRKHRHSAYNERRARQAMGKYFRDNWQIAAQTIIGVMVDPASKPSDKKAAAATALEFGFGKSPTQETPPVGSGVPKLRFGDGFPTVEAIKAKHARKIKTETD